MTQLTKVFERRCNVRRSAAMREYFLLWLFTVILSCTVASYPQLLQAAAPDEKTTAVASGDQKDQWEEEILLQLSELRKAQGELSKQVEALRAQVESLHTADRKDSGVSLDLRNDNYPVLGNNKADVAIVEFSDFECPYCRRHHQNTVPGLVDKYINGGKVKYVFVDYPLGFHSHAEPTAVAAACAHKKGAFWKMHDSLFQSQNTLGEDLFLKLASDLHLNVGDFRRCLEDPKMLEQVRAQAQLGDALGVNGTPAFFVGRVRGGTLVDAKEISGAQPLSVFERALDPLLAAGRDGK